MVVAPLPLQGNAPHAYSSPVPILPGGGCTGDIPALHLASSVSFSQSELHEETENKAQNKQTVTVAHRVSGEWIHPDLLPAVSPFAQGLVCPLPHHIQGLLFLCGLGLAGIPGKETGARPGSTDSSATTGSHSNHTSPSAVLPKSSVDKDCIFPEGHDHRLFRYWET